MSLASNAVPNTEYLKGEQVGQGVSHKSLRSLPTLTSNRDCHLVEFPGRHCVLYFYIKPGAGDIS